MKKVRFETTVLALGFCLVGAGQLSVVYAQDPSVGDVGAPNQPDLTNDPSVRVIPDADSIRDKSPELFAHQYRVGHFTRVLHVTGTQGEDRPVNVHLWYPALGSNECQNSGNSAADPSNSDGNGNEQGCSATPTVYTSRLNGISLGSLGDPLRWTINSVDSFENLPISRAHGSFPVIVFSHGNQNNAIDYVYTLETLASFGFIVAAPDHVNNTQDDVRIDFINAKAKSTVIPCFDGLSSPCAHTSVPESMIDRFNDVRAVIDALPTWFGDRADTSRVGVMGHSRGTVTALAAAGGSTLWGFTPDLRVKAIMGLAIGAPAITFGANVHDIGVPALLVAGGLDRTAPATTSQAAFNTLSSTEKAFILIPNAEHRHFDSGLCAQTQSSGAIAQRAEAPGGGPNTTRAILDLQTVRTLVNTDVTPTSGIAMNFCGLETFTQPNDIRDLVSSLSVSKQTPTPFDFSSQPVPTNGLNGDQVRDEVINLAVVFFGHVLDRDGEDDRPFTDFLP
jgi:predicted dienelactone hydrolase